MAANRKHLFIAGLFHQAILQSGTDLAPWAYNDRGQEPEEYLRQTALQVNCPIADTQEMTDCLKTKSREELQDTDFNCTVSVCQ